MNYFAHGRAHVDDPYRLAGTAVPDWLNVVDRKVRARSKGALPVANQGDPQAAAVAQGVLEHHRDDAWFHSTPAFAELSCRFTTDIRDAIPRDDGLRPSFLGHILVEILLDWALAAEDPSALEAYYAALATVDPAAVEQAVAQIAGRPATGLARFIGLFVEHRFLFDYADDDKLLFRLNQVMRRVKLSPLPAEFTALLARFRPEVQSRRQALLTAPITPSQKRDAEQHS
ncbi:MAG: hypothetical protein KDA41_15750 [Planctomycetales bacterium]|nr:hypothetical protein [Planctomycetales bacterium]